MNFSTKNQVALVIALLSSAATHSAFAEGGRPSEPMAQVVVVDTCASTKQTESQGSYYTYLRVVDGMTRDSALKAAQYIDNPASQRSRATASDIAPGVISAAPSASAVLR